MTPLTARPAWLPLLSDASLQHLSGLAVFARGQACTVDAAAPQVRAHASSREALRSLLQGQSAVLLAGRLRYKPKRNFIAGLP